MLKRLFSALLILLVSSGGAGLPLLDGLLFHGLGHRTESLRPHFEATSGCHEDGCTVRSTAQQGRYAPVLNALSRMVPAQEFAAALRALPLPPREPLRGQPLSRAPPPVLG